MRPVVRFGIAPILGMCLVLGLRSAPHLGAHASMPLPGRAPHSFPPGSFRLYRATADWSALQELSPGSLADRSGAAFHIGPPFTGNSWPAIAATSDGSRFAVLSAIHPNKPGVGGRDLMLKVFDAKTGERLFADHPAVPASMMGISADGSVVYGLMGDNNFTHPCGSTSFYLLDARTGRVLQHFTIAARRWDPMLVGPKLGRLYVMTVSDHVNGCGPQNAYSPLIIAYDLRSGQEVASLRLKGVPAGNWNTHRKINGEIIGENWQPGLALRPDGSQLAVLDGHTDTLMLLQDRNLRIVGREQLTRPKTALQAVAALLGLAPEAAEAKGEIDGVGLQVQYTPDGHSLLVTGYRLRPSRRHLYSSSQSLGIRLVNVAGGQIRAQLNDPKGTTGIWIAPDGSAVYSAVQGWSRQGGWFTTLRRHDPATLQIGARRTFLHTAPLSLFFLQ